MNTSERMHSRRRVPATGRIPILLAALLALATCHAALAADAPVRSVESVGITVSDLERSVAFYRDVLSFREEERYEVHGGDYEQLYGVFGMRLVAARLRLGDERVELMQFLAPAGRPVPADSRSNDRWFQHIALITGDMDRAYRHLREHRVQHASSGPQTLPEWNPNAGGIAAFYFRDPDGNHLEILQFPPDKGNPKWHRPGPLFLGIDHTAIVVADTETSLAYYRDFLGMRVAGASENYGPEQERLNNVFGARLRITALQAGAGPGVELLEYLAPRSGRPMPGDTLASDLWHWQVNFSAADVEDVWAGVAAGQATAISSMPVAPVDRSAGYRRAVLVRDPDGHAGLVAEP